MPCLVNHKRQYCNDCPLGTTCAVLNMALDEAILTNNYKAQAEVEEAINWYRRLTDSRTYIVRER